MLNTITGQDFDVSDSAKGTTFETKTFEDFKYNGEIYQFIDTAGLDEGSKGTVPRKNAIKNLIEFVINERKEGFNLFIMVMAKGTISDIIEKNYELFINYIKIKEIPTLCVVTGCENDKPLNKWVDKCKGDFENSNMKFDGMIGSCFAQERDGNFAKTYEELCEKSRVDVMKKIEIQIHEQSKVVETPTPQVEEKVS